VDTSKALSFYNEGRKLSLMGDHKRAVKKFEKAVKLFPDFYEAHNSLAISCQSLGLLSSALKHIEIANRLNRNNPIIVTNLGNINRDLGNYKIAEKLYLDVISRNPEYQLASSNLALLYIKLEKLSDAFEIIYNSKNTHLDAFILLFSALKNINILNREDTLKFTKYFVNSFILLSQEDKWQQRLVSELAKNDSKNCKAQGVIEYLLNTDFKKDDILNDVYSLLPFIKSIPACQTSFDYLSARKLIHDGRPDEAITLLKSCINKSPNEGLLIYLTDALYWTDQLSEAQKAENHLIKLNPKAISYFGVYSAFKKLNIKEGWRKLLALKTITNVRGAIPGCSLSEARNSQRILIYGNQGIGDQIMFLSTLEKFISAVGHPVTLYLDARLHPIINRSFQNVETINTISDELESNFDCKLLLEDVCFLVQNTLQDFYPNKQFLTPDPYLCSHFKSKLNSLPGTLNIGISWKGGSVGSNVLKIAKSALLEDFTPLLELENVNWINLQYGNVTNELAKLKKQNNINIYDFEEVNPLDEIETQAALISELDLVIQVSNASAHIAGAVGTPVWTLLGNPPDWRWFTENNSDKTPWYSSMTIKQKPSGWTWKQFIQKIRIEFENGLNLKS